LVSRIGSYGSSWSDLRASSASAAAQGRLGLAAAQAYLQASVPAAGNGGGAVTQTPTPSSQSDQSAFQPQDSQNGTSQGTQDQAAPDGFQTAFQQGADFSQMLAIQEAASQEAASQAAPAGTASSLTPRLSGQALGAYSAAMALVPDASSRAGYEMDMPGWGESGSAGGSVSLTA
jgi:hypothetical protein